MLTKKYWDINSQCHSRHLSAQNQVRSRLDFILFPLFFTVHLLQTMTILSPDTQTTVSLPRKSNIIPLTLSS
jgi:hypothetical protein